MDCIKLNANEIKITRTQIVEEVKSYEQIISDKAQIEKELYRVTHQNDERIAQLQAELDAVNELLGQCEVLSVCAKPVEVVKEEIIVEEPIIKEEEILPVENPIKEEKIGRNEEEIIP